MSLARTMTVAEAAEYLGVTHQWVLNRINRKKIKGVKRAGVWMLSRHGIERLKTRRSA